MKIFIILFSIIERFIYILANITCVNNIDFKNEYQTVYLNDYYLHLHHKEGFANLNRKNKVAAKILPFVSL